MAVRLVGVIAIAFLFAATATGQFLPITNQLTSANPQRQATLENAPPAEAFRVLPPSDAEGPQITRYLLYQTALAWNQDELRRDRWSQVKNENDLLRLRAELRKSVLEMIGGLPTEKTDLHAAITGTISTN